MERLQKFLSRAGVASRRAAEALILEGKVKVNGLVVTEMGSRVDPDKDLVVVSGQPITASAQRQYFLLYKPPGVVTTLSDPQGRATVADFIQRIPGRVYPVGRLDFDAEGALLLTDDGELANQLMHPSHQVPRVYLAKVKGEPDQASLDKLLAGVRLEDGLARAVEVRRFELAERNTWLKLVVTEGRQHLVKRLCAAIGHPVVRLFRPAHAGVSVQGMKPGQVRPVSDGELRQVRALVAGAPAPELELFLPGRRHGHGYSTGLGGDAEPEEEVEVPVAAAAAVPVAEVEDEGPQEVREYFSKRGPDPVPRPEKPPAVGRGRPAQGAEDRGGPPRKPAVARPGPSRFAPPVAVEEDEEGDELAEASAGDESPIEAPRRREPGAFGRGGGRGGRPARPPSSEGSGPRREGPDGRLGKPASRPRYGTAGPRSGGPGGRAGKPPGRFGAPEADARAAPRREGPGGASGGRFEKPAGGARSGGPRREGPGGARFEKPAGGARFGGPRREGPGGGRFEKPAGGARFGGPRREGPGGARSERPEGGARFGGPRRAGPGGASAGRFGGPRRESPGGASRGRFGKPEGGARFGGPRREGPGAGGRKPAGGSRFGASSGPRRDGPGGPRRGPPRGGPRKPGGFAGGRPGGKRPGPRR